MTPNTVHDLASVTKAVTTTALARLVSDGAVNLADDVRRYVPTFAHQASIRDLLLHRAGLWEWWPLYVQARDRDAAHAVVDTLPLRYRPGLERHYSDLGFVLLGRVIEAAAETDLATAVHDLVAAPLSLSTLGFGPRHDADIATSLRSGLKCCCASSANANPKSACRLRSWNSSNRTAAVPSSAGSPCNRRVNTPSVTTSMRVARLTRVSRRMR